MEINLFGVDVEPIAPMIHAAWLLLLPLRRLADRFGLLGQIWHPSLLLFEFYLVLLSAVVLLAGRIAG
jgi:hypothetical protein